MHPCAGSVLLTVGLTVLGICVANAQEARPLSAEEIVSASTLQWLAPVEFSPSGTWVTYTVANGRRVRPGKEGVLRGVPAAVIGSDVWIVNVETRETINVTGGVADNWGSSWSPDGNYLALHSDRDGVAAKVWIYKMATRELRKLSDSVLGDFNTIQWTPDSKSVLTKILPGGVQGNRETQETQEKGRHADDKDRVTARVYEGTKTSASDPWSLDASRGDLVLIDVVSGKVQTLDSGHPIRGYWISPDGTNVAFTVPKNFERPGSQRILYDLVVLNLRSRQRQVCLSDAALSVWPLSWAPSGTSFSLQTLGVDARLYIANLFEGKWAIRNKEGELNPGSLRALWGVGSADIYFARGDSFWKLPVKGVGKASEVARLPGHRLEMIAQRGGQLWSPAQGGSTVLMTVHGGTKQFGFFQIDLSSGTVRKVIEEDKFYGATVPSEAAAVSRDGRRLAYLSQSANLSPDLWLLDESLAGPKRLTNLAPQLDRVKMGVSRLVKWRNADGEPVQGALLLPVAYQSGIRYPLIVYQYPNRPVSEEVNRFGAENSAASNWQLFATHGYAVLVPEVRVRPGTVLADVAKAILPGVDKVIEMGLADPTRIGVIGHSAGGYSALALIVQTTRFQAAVMYSGMGDLVAAYGQLRDDSSSYGVGTVEPLFVGGTLWDRRQQFIENSPVFYLDRVKTPLLIVHGTEDDIVPVFLADQIFVGLRRLGRDVEYVRYAGEGHVISGYSNSVDYLHRVITWFDHHLVK